MQSSAATDLVTDKISHYIGRQPSVRLAILFGSYARGTPQAGSDLDLAVLANEGTDLIALAAELEQRLGIAVDIVDLVGAPYALLLEVLRDGVRLYERAPGVHARFLSATLADLETDLPALRRMQRAFTARVARDGLG